MKEDPSILDLYLSSVNMAGFEYYAGAIASDQDKNAISVQDCIEQTNEIKEELIASDCKLSSKDKKNLAQTESLVCISLKDARTKGVLLSLPGTSEYIKFCEDTVAFIDSLLKD